MTTKNGKTVYLQAVTMVDPATGRIEIRTVPSAHADLVSNTVELPRINKINKQIHMATNNDKALFNHKRP